MQSDLHRRIGILENRICDALSERIEDFPAQQHVVWELSNPLHKESWWRWWRR